MLKKILSIVLAIMLLSSIAVVSHAEAAEKTEWVETFDSIDPAHLTGASASSTSPLWVLTKACTEHTPYSANGEGGHYHLNDGWTMQSRGFASGSYNAYNAWSLKSGDHGKKNSDKSLYADSLNYHHVNLKNDFDGTPVDLTGGKAVGFSFDWYDSSTQAHAAHLNLYREIKMTVTLGKEGADDIEDIELNLGQLKWERFISAVTTYAYASGFESWHDFAMLVSKDKVLVQASSKKSSISFDIANYTPATADAAASWNKDANSGYYIKSIKSVEVHLRGSGKNVRQNGIDNLKTWIENTMPSTLPAKTTPVFANLTAAHSTLQKEGIATFKLVSGNLNDRIGVQLAGTNSTNIIKPSLVVDDNDTVKSSSGAESWLKVTYDAAAEIGSNVFYTVYFDKTGTQIGSAGDVAQASCDIKFKGDPEAKSNTAAWQLVANFATGAGYVMNIAADGTVYESADNPTPIAKLDNNKWYNISATFTLKDDATEAIVYIDGVPVLERTLTGNWSDLGTVRFYFNPELNATRDAYLANTVYLDNICYNFFEDGEGAYNFDKSLATANNKVVAAATEDFVNGVIAPISADWTVGEFNALGVANAAVVDSEDVVVADEAALIKDYRIRFIGDYGKTMYYTVSEDGATLVDKKHLVIVNQNGTVLTDDNCAVGAAITAEAYDTAGAVSNIITAEYDATTLKLVDVKIGGGYAPSEAGNTVKVFAIKNLDNLVPATPATALVVE